MSHLNMFPPENPPPPPSTLPQENAKRWYSFDEDPGFQPQIPIFVGQNAYLQLVEHASSDLENEVGGVLVGTWSIDDESRRQFIVVETALPARFTRQGSVYLTFTQDSLVDLHVEMDDHYPGKQMVGWYHTHPGFGIFLSPYDTWLHRHFFSEPWQVALVIDPHSSSGGFFIRKEDGSLDPGRGVGFYELVGDSGQSIVNWSNLRQDPVTADQKGDEFDE